MNKVILMGRLTRDPEVRTSAGESGTEIARYTLAVDRRFKRDGEPNADFINCVSFGRLAEFAEKYLHQGTKVVISGRIQTGSYVNKDGQRIYTTDVIVEEVEFAESKKASDSAASAPQQTAPTTAQNQPTPEAAMPAPEDPGFDEDIPFN